MVAPHDVLFAEDLIVGEQHVLGSHAVTHDEIITFAQQWDPQDFHIDDDVAAAGFFGEVIASGIHTLAVLQRLSVLNVYRDWAVVAGKSLRDVQFRSPVKAGMTLGGTLTVSAVDLSRPGRALVVKDAVLTCGDITVLTATVDVYVRRRPQPD